MTPEEHFARLRDTSNWTVTVPVAPRPIRRFLVIAAPIAIAAVLVVAFVVGASTLRGMRPIPPASPTPTQSTTPTSEPTDSSAPTETPTDAPVTAQPADFGNWIVSSQGIGPIRLGMDDTQLRALHDPKLEIETFPDVGQTCHVSSADWPEGQGGDILTGMLDDDRSTAYVIVAQYAGAGPHTAEGIGIGSTLAEAKATYPGAVYTPGTGDYPQTVSWKSNGVWIIAASYDQNGLQDTIYEFTVGQASRPMAGCGT